MRLFFAFDIKKLILSCLLFIISSLSAESKLPVMENFEKANEMAKAYQKPLVLIFLGSDWCELSQKFIKNILEDAEFEKISCNDFLFVKIDFPELNNQSSNLLEKNYELKQRFHIQNFPTLIILDNEDQEISALGYLPCSGKEYAKQLRYIVTEYHKLKSYLENVSLEKADTNELKSLYIRSRDLMSYPLMEEILSEGVTRFDGMFFLVERYSNLIAQGKKDSKEARSIREKIEQNESKDSNSRLRLAILDFQEEANKTSVHPKEALQPLLDYLAACKDSSNGEIWRIYLMASQYLFSYGYMTESLKLLEEGRNLAPSENKKEVIEMEDFIKSHLSNSFP
ncbi:MAG: hypothetical protein Tsb0015_04300 [Simkaniaceae bacterium]